MNPPSSRAAVLFLFLITGLAAPSARGQGVGAPATAPAATPAQLANLAPGSAPRVASLTQKTGLVQRRPAGWTRWENVAAAPFDLAAGDSLRTGARAAATVVFEDGSRVELGGNATFTVEEGGGKGPALRLELGSLKAWVNKLSGLRRFSVRTPTAVCSVRGTEFRVEVMGGGRTVVDLYKGLLAVADVRGQELLLRPNERVQVDAGGLGTPGALPTSSQLQRAQFQQLMRREMSLDMSKEEVQAAAAREIKLAEFQQGKVLVDVFGKRVRLEEYIVRPRSDQFKLVVLNERADRFDYFYYLGTFNTTLPDDLSIALRQLGGSLDTAPGFYLTAFETGRSNTVDSVVEVAQGGHPVDVNNNGATAGDDIASFFNPTTDKFEDVTGRPVYQTLFDRYGFYVNGRLKYGWTGNDAQSYLAGGVTLASNNDPITGAALATALPARSVSSTFPDASQIHQVIYESYSDGTFTKWDNYIIDDEGRIATVGDFAGVTTGASYKEKLLDFNYEQVITASEFSGRKIDLVVEPRILIQSGLIQ